MCALDALDGDDRDLEETADHLEPPAHSSCVKWLWSSQDFRFGLSCLPFAGRSDFPWLWFCYGPFGTVKQQLGNEYE